MRSGIKLLVGAGLASAMAACVGSEDGALEVGATEQDVVGGTTTTSHPEIGYTVLGGGCTATLIAPRYYLAAAHCLSPMYTGTTVGAGYRFDFTDASGVARSYPVERIQSFTNRRWENTPGGVMTTDLALIKLTSAVPASQAVPAPMASRRPYAGERATLFGFGCSDRTPETPSGTGATGKQYLSFNYGTATTALCWGDSGGPVIFGNVTGNGALWGVNSDFGVGDGTTDGMTDVFADVFFHRHMIEDVMHRWDGPIERGWDRPGLDYRTVASASSASCSVECRNDSACRSFSWAGGTCFLKSGVPEAVPVAGVDSGLPSTQEPGINRAGMDITGFYLAEPRVELCAAECALNTSCKAYTYVAPSGGVAAACWLKSGVPAVSSCASCTSGVLDRSVEANVNRWGGDIALQSASNPRECAKQCAANESCRAYTFTGGSTNNCWLKGEVPAANAQSGMSSGVRRGMEVNVNRWGSDIRGFWTAHPSPFECQSACINEGACRSWTYVPPTTTEARGACWLKSAVAAPYAATGLISGIRGMEFAQ